MLAAVPDIPDNESERRGKRILLEMLAAVPDIPDDECGKEFTAPCPCGGTIKAMRSAENGRIHAYCEKCGFRMHE